MKTQNAIAYEMIDGDKKVEEALDAIIDCFVKVGIGTAIIEAVELKEYIDPAIGYIDEIDREFDERFGRGYNVTYGGGFKGAVQAVVDWMASKKVDVILNK